MQSAGEKLRRERMERGLDLATLSSVTRISRRYLEAIESGNTAELPGDFFHRSFVRQYAVALGLDPAVVDVAPPPDKTGFPLRSPDRIVMESNRHYLPPGRMWASVLLFFVVLTGCSAVYAKWYRMQTALPLSEPSPQAVVEDRIVVKLSATAPTWVSVLADGRSVFAGTMQAHQSVTLGGRERTQIKVGNAGGLDLFWNGKTLGPLGPTGQTRHVLLTPESYSITAPDGSL